MIYAHVWRFVSSRHARIDNKKYSFWNLIVSGRGGNSPQHSPQGFDMVSPLRMCLAKPRLHTNVYPDTQKIEHDKIG